MKTTKSILVTIILFFAFIGFTHTESSTANYDRPNDNMIIKISIRHVSNIPALKMAIYDQISPVFLKTPICRDYSFIVIVHRQQYFVTGSYYDWAQFFYHYK